MAVVRDLFFRLVNADSSMVHQPQAFHPNPRCATNLCTRGNARHFSLSHKHKEPLAHCGLLPVAWSRLVQKQAQQIRVSKAPITHALADTVLIKDNKLYWLNPRSDKYHSFDRSAKRGNLTLRSRPLGMVQTLYQMSLTDILPDAIFQLSYDDVPVDKRSRDAPSIPTVAIHGWLHTAFPFMRYPESPIFGAVQHESARWSWSGKDSKVIYADGKEWSSQMPGDTFRLGRKEIRKLAKENPFDIVISKALPFENGSRFKYALYLDGVGPSFRLQYLLLLGSVVFIPEMVIPNWPMALIRPYVHFIPVHRNLSNLMSQLRWAKSHDAEAKKIASASASFMKYTMHKENRWCAMHETVRAVAERQRGLELVVDDVVCNVCQ